MEKEGNWAGSYKTTLWSSWQGVLRRQRIQAGSTIPLAAGCLGHGKGTKVNQPFRIPAQPSWVLDYTKSLFCVLDDAYEPEHHSEPKVPVLG